MQIAILHYHLNRGGVTQVISNHLRALDEALEGSPPVRVALFYGGRLEGWDDDVLASLGNVVVSKHVVDRLDYDDDPAAAPEPQRLADDLARELGRIGFDPQGTILHAHNHAIGKNVSLPGAIRSLAEAAYPLLLQIHDFAEDFRSGQYVRLSAALSSGVPLATALYPQSPHIHYAVLNGRDRRIMTTAGVSDERLHWLPNPVVESERLPDRDAARRVLAERCEIPSDVPMVLYPVRCIRRKNVGELLLWSAARRGQAIFATTLAPINPEELAAYQRWQRLANQLQLPVRFDLNRCLSFPENLAAADALITTSAAEGFGMVFLEASLAGRRLLGRKLPEITSDFEQNGLDLTALYDSLDIPTEWIGIDRLRVAVLDAYAVELTAFGREPDAQSAACFDRIIDNGTIDFAMLTPELQSEVIVLLNDSATHRDRLLDLNPAIAATMTESVDRASVTANAQLVREHYNPLACGKQLLEIYQGLLNGARTASLAGPERGSSILDQFLDIRRFRPLRSLS